MKRIFFSLLIISAIAAGAIGASQAFFSDTETSTNNVFQAGVLDLLIDNTSYYNGALSPHTTWALDNLPGHLFFDFQDLKPDDEGEDTISIHVNDNEAWACMNMSLTANLDNTCTEPELLDDPSCTPGEEATNSGELADEVNFVFWVDDGDNVLESNEATEAGILAQGNAGQVLNSSFALADSQNNVFGGAVGDGLDPQTTYYIGKAWCFGELGLDPVPQGEGVDPTQASGVTCNGENLNNATQTDILKADISFSAVQHRNNPNFLCDGGEPTPTPSSTPIACIETFAATSQDNNQGTRKNGTAINLDRTNPTSMFGPPQSSGTPSDSPVIAGSFFSLGFTNGNIVLGFASPFYQNPGGDDLQVFEVTGGVYPDEKVKVEVATNPAGPWFDASPNPGTRDAGFEMPIASAQFVRLTESSDIIPFEATADGYDVDAVKALCGTAAQ